MQFIVSSLPPPLPTTTMRTCTTITRSSLLALLGFVSFLPALLARKIAREGQVDLQQQDPKEFSIEHIFNEEKLEALEIFKGPTTRQQASNSIGMQIHMGKVDPGASRHSHDIIVHRSFVADRMDLEFNADYGDPVANPDPGPIPPTTP